MPFKIGNQFGKKNKGKQSRKGAKLSELTKEKIRKSLLGYKHSEISKKRMGESRKGRIAWNKGKTYHVKKTISRDKNPNWKGGKSFEPYSVDWTKTLKRAIRERDNYICQICNQYGHSVHHIDYDKKNCNPSNLITLCKECHGKTNGNRNGWIKFFVQKRCL